tara:strand:+ start:236 stop:553 length:318 start_codon:yes stop_codon:yes gene_type:complete
MNTDWVLGQANADLPLIEPIKTAPVTGKIVLDKAPVIKQPIKLPETPVKVDKVDVTKLKDYIAPEDLDPINRFMNWSKKHPKGQDGPMKSENKMISFERKNNKTM